MRRKRSASTLDNVGPGGATATGVSANSILDRGPQFSPNQPGFDAPLPDHLLSNAFLSLEEAKYALRSWALTCGCRLTVRSTSSQYAYMICSLGRRTAKLAAADTFCPFKLSLTKSAEGWRAYVVAFSHNHPLYANGSLAVRTTQPRQPSLTVAGPSASIPPAST